MRMEASPIDLEIRLMFSIHFLDLQLFLYSTLKNMTLNLLILLMQSQKKDSNSIKKRKKYDFMYV